MTFTRTGKFRVFLWIGQAFLFCATDALSQSDSTILARIADKVLSVREFKLRTELTIRPDNFKDKNAALDNLISEKILSLEAQQTSQLPANPVFQATLKGIKEQAMRDKLQEEVAAQNIRIDTAEMKTAYSLSQREYEVEFYTFRDRDLAGRITDALENAPELSDEVFRELESMAGKKPVRKVQFKDPDDEAIHDALFSSPLDTGSVVGPLKLGSGEYIVMRVVNWVDYPLVSGDEQLARWAEVKDFLRQSKARKLWVGYQAELMKGKKIEFNRSTFTALSDIAFKYYVLRKERDSSHVETKSLPLLGQDLDLKAPFFTIDGKTWSVGEFQQELLSHPLVFRTTALDSMNFKREFKLAVVDMVRDHYLTLESYERTLDASDEVSRTVEMWKDALLAQDEQKRIIESTLKDGKINADDREGVRQFWTSYLQNLQMKYSNRIVINQAVLAKITLTNIDLFAYRQGVPYPVVVPEFPLFISTQKLDAMLRKLLNL
ncbi:MAG: hypothetical protein ABSB78_10055 [Bacteroidota bacterium]